MSYPNNLGARINHITNYSTNSVMLRPDNSIVELNGITNGAKLEFTLPPNSLVDLSSFSVYAELSTAAAVTTAGQIRPHYLTRYANSLIHRLTVEIGGQVVNDIQDYNRIQQIFSDYQFGIEGSSKKLLSNIDPLDKRNTAGVQVGGLRPLAVAAENALIRNDSRPICLTQFLGFLGGGAGVKYIDTQLTGNIKITFELAPANNVLFRASEGNITGSDDTAGANAADTDCAAQSSYSLTSVVATIKKASIDDGVYFQSITAALTAGIPFEYKYNHFYQTKSNITNGNLTMRYEVMSNSIDLAMLTFYENAYNTAVANLPNKALLAGNASPADAAALLASAQGSSEFYNGVNPKLTAKQLAVAGKENCYCSGYFKRNGSFITKCRFYINGERLPQFDMNPPMVFNQSLIDFGIHDDTANGIYYGINTFDSWKNNYWVATARLSHICNDESYISGFNANGVPLTLSVETDGDGVAGNDYTAQLYVMTTEVLQVYAGRQINRIK
jgi:hypothetical protein